MAMLLTAGISIAFFGLAPSLPLALGILVASCSVVLYYGNMAWLGGQDGGAGAQTKLPK